MRGSLNAALPAQLGQNIRPRGLRGSGVDPRRLRWRATSPFLCNYAVPTTFIDSEVSLTFMEPLQW